MVDQLSLANFSLTLTNCPSSVRISIIITFQFSFISIFILSSDDIVHFGTRNEETVGESEKLRYARLKGHKKNYPLSSKLLLVDAMSFQRTQKTIYREKVRRISEGNLGKRGKIKAMFARRNADKRAITALKTSGDTHVDTYIYAHHT